MARELIKVSLIEFMNYVNKSGTAKATVVINAKTKREEEYQFYKDYWLKLRKKIKEVHKKKLSKEDYCSFWGKKKSRMDKASQKDLECRRYSCRAKS
ncbi:hypothetical protein [uncultured Bacteroides sp.]|uniref:hypothetical protein n=1 Tax=uncultured Bacteroides sp. TaxID=162156 RepID=UPI002AAACB39|nr:hypothetical protein [uncultured Bacteroides sp.]